MGKKKRWGTANVFTLLVSPRHPGRKKKKEKPSHWITSRRTGRKAAPSDQTARAVPGGAPGKTPSFTCRPKRDKALVSHSWIGPGTGPREVPGGLSPIFVRGTASERASRGAAAKFEGHLPLTARVIGPCRPTTRRPRRPADSRSRAFGAHLDTLRQDIAGCRLDALDRRGRGKRKRGSASGGKSPPATVRAGRHPHWNGRSRRWRAHLRTGHRDELMGRAREGLIRGGNWERGKAAGFRLDGRKLAQTGDGRGKDWAARLERSGSHRSRRNSGGPSIRVSPIFSSKAAAVRAPGLTPSRSGWRTGWHWGAKVAGLGDAAIATVRLSGVGRPASGDRFDTTKTWSRSVYAHSRLSAGQTGCPWRSTTGGCC